MQRADELQVQIDDVHACIGSCAGCVLSSDERVSVSPDMTNEVLALSERRLVEYAVTLPALRRVNVTFGLADHLRMSEDYVVSLHGIGSRIVAAGRPSDSIHSGVFFTTSLIGKEKAVVSLLGRIAGRTRGGAPFMPLVVLDPKLIKALKFGPAWRTMVKAAKDLFGKADLSINLSDEAIALMEPGELLDFAEKNGFDEVTVNWTPTLSNARQTLGNVEATRSWLAAFDRDLLRRPALGTSYRPVIERTVQAVMCMAGDGVPSAREVVEALLPETLRKSIQVDHRGTLMPKFEAIGDVAHARRHGFEPLGNLFDAGVGELLDRGMSRVLSRILSVHSRSACLSCPVSGICAGTGFHVATDVAKRTGLAADDGCPHVARKLIETILAEAHARDQARIAA